MSWLAYVDANASVFWQHMGSAAWQAAALALLVLLAVTLGRKWPSPLRHGLLLIALLKFAMPPVLPAPVGFFPWLDQGLGYLDIWSVEMAPEPIAPRMATSRQQTAPPVQEGPILTLAAPTIWLYLLVAYALGAMVMMLRLAHAHRRLCRWQASAREVDDPVILALYAETCQRLQLKHQPRLLVSDEAEVAPMAFGAWRPVILLPRQAVQTLDAEALGAVMAHELAHHVRGDLWVQWMQNVLAIVWWFHPVFHVLTRQLRGVREDCCDDLLLGRGLVSDRRYCEAILDTADLVTAPLPATSLGFADHLHPLGRRLRRILDRDLHRAPRLSTFSVALLITVAVGSLPGRMIGDPLGEERKPFLAKAERLADHELARFWPASTLSQLATAPEGVQLDRVHFQGNAIQMKGRAKRTHDVARLFEHLTSHPAMVDAKTIRVTPGDHNYEFQFDLIFDWSVTSPPGPEADWKAKIRALTPNHPTKVQMAMTSIRGVLTSSSWNLERFEPRALQNRGPFAEWRLEVEGTGTFREIHQLLLQLARVSSLAYHSLDLVPTAEGDLRMEAVLTTLLRNNRSSDQEVPGVRRFSGKLEQIHQALSTLRMSQIILDTPPRDPFETKG